MKELVENTIFVGVCAMLLCVTVLTGCEGGGSGGSSSDASGVNYTDTAADSFAYETNNTTDSFDTSIPTNTTQPFTKEEFKDLSESMTSNYASYFE